MKERTFTKGSSRIAFIALLFLMLAAFAMLLPLKAHAADIAGGTYDNVDWRLTSDGKLELGKSGEPQTFTVRGRRAEDFPWYEHRGSIKKIELMGSIVGQGSFSGIFMNETNLTEIVGWELMDTSKVTNLDALFWGDINLKSVNVSKMITSNATVVSRVFRDCKKLETLDCSSWDLSNVLHPYEIFYGCHSLTSVGDLSKWNIGSKATSISYLFDNCRSLETLTGYENWDVSNVQNFTGVFRGCYALKSVNTTKWNTSNGIYMADMYNGLKEVEELDASNIDTSKAITLQYFFANMPKLKTLKHNLDTSSAQRMEALFVNDESLTSLDLTNVTTKAVDPALHPNRGTFKMFQNCKNLEAITGLAADFVGSNVDNTAYMFDQCNKLNPIDVSKYDMSNVKPMNDMFRGCNSVEKLDVKNWDTSSATAMNGLFQYCYALTELDVKGFKTDNVENFIAMFAGLENVEVIDVSKFNTGSGELFWNMFSGCKSVKELDVDSFDTSNATDIHGMFSGCPKVKELDVSNFNTSNVEDMNSLFANCTNLESVDVSGFDTSNTKNMSNMFLNCTSLNKIDASGFDTSNVEYFNGMFNGTEAKEIDVTGFDTGSALSTAGMFANNNKLTEVKGLDKFDTSKVENTSKMFANTPLFADDAMLNLDMSSVTKAEGMYAQADALKESLKTQMGAAYVDSFSSPLKEQVKDALAKIEAVFAKDSEATPAEIKAMVNAAKAAISTAGMQLPSNVDSALTDANNKKATADAEAAKDKTSDAAKAAAAAAKEAADKAKALADAAKSVADAALAKDPTNPTLQAAAKIAADKAAAAAAAQAAAQKLYNEVVNPSIPPTGALQVGERFVVADQTYEVLTVPASGNCSATLVKANNAKTVVVPETVAYKSRTFEVNEINTKAFYKNTKKVTLGANVDTIDKQAFKGSK
ncbi:MAG: BspA family leucine-rich repeat surface protein, partial [Mogibacterium sp.]|nr:BspA family leucine-rich repeat surface protein [Mogibacterium sp.]